MTEIHDRPVPRRDELQLLLEDLACVSGTLSEIMTAWRRAQPHRPGLQPGRLVRLQDAARQLAADIQAAAGIPAVLLDPSTASRLTALEQDAAAVRALTAGPGGPGAGDGGLWDLIAAAVRRARARLAALGPAPAAVPG
jgi:hypothetical protein